MHYSKNVLVKILGSKCYRHFLKKIQFFWAFFEILRQKYVHLARALPYIYIYIYMTHFKGPVKGFLGIPRDLSGEEASKT